MLPRRHTDPSFLSVQEKDQIVSSPAEEKSQKLDEHQISALRTLMHLRVWQPRMYLLLFKLAARVVAPAYETTIYGIITCLGNGGD